MIKKLFIFSNYSGGYGSESSLGDVYQALSKAYNVTSVMNPAVPIPKQYCEQYNVEELYFNILSKNSLIPSVFSVIKLIKFLKKRQPDKVIANISVMPELYIACLYCKVPLYIIIRESLIDFGHVFTIYKWFLAMCSKKLIANSLYTKSMFGLMRNVELLYNRIDMPCDNLSVDTTQKYDFIYLGRLSERKGIKILFEALGQLSVRFEGKVRIVIVGGVKAGEESLLDEMAACKSAFSNIDIEWVGFQSEPANYIKLSNFMVAPSLLPETFGRTLIESGALGVPVVSSDVGAYQEVNPLKEFVFSTGDSAALADKMLTLLHLNEIKYQALQDFVKKDSQRYSFNHYQKNLKAILND